MSRQIQFRRGTSTEHQTFTGAIGEITVDTTNKTLRIHDGTTAGGTILAKQSEIPDLSNADYVVASQLPTAENNYTWYRKYKSGWVEQGGIYDLGTDVTTSNEYSISLPVEMSDTYYTAIVVPGGNTSGGNFGSYIVVVDAHLQTTSLAAYVFKTETSYRFINWHVSGVAASDGD